jgi:hypothetical protein
MGSKNADATLQMTPDVQATPDLCNGWRTEANDLARGLDWEFYQAFDRVLVKYLMAGYSQPLRDLVLNLKRQPGMEVARYIAAMIDARRRCTFQEHGFPFEIRVKIKRKKSGRPRARECEIAPSVHLDALDFGLSRIERWCTPGRSFWFTLARALNHREKGGEFPIKANLVRTDGVKGRPPNPELCQRDRVLAWFVDEKRAKGAKRECALRDVQKEIEREGQYLHPETISTAYKRFGAKRRFGTKSRRSK